MLTYKNFKGIGEGFLKGVDAERQSLVVREFEDFLRARILETDERVKRLWHYDYSSINNYLKSVEDNRKDWKKTVGVWEGKLDPLKPVFYPYFEDEKIIAKWVILPFKDNLRCHGAIAFPKKKKGKLPVLIFQHGVGTAIEQVFGLWDADAHYHSVGSKLAEEGYTVLAPVNVNWGGPRSRLERLCLLLGTTLHGLEIRKYQRWIDFLETLPEINKEKIGMWGLSLGGFYVMITMPVEQRIKVGINAAFFNHRVTKMSMDDPRFSSFITGPDGEHIYIPGWLSKFRDSELASLTCPRPLQIQAGKADGISWYPLLKEEFERSKIHYEKLGIGKRIELLLHEGGHEIKLEEGIKFLKKWL